MIVKMPRFRFRYIAIFGGSAMILAALLLTDPDRGLSTAFWLLSAGTACVLVGLAHLFRKALFDYPEADLQVFFANARTSATGSGLALVAVAVVLHGLFDLIARVAAR